MKKVCFSCLLVLTFITGMGQQNIVPNYNIADLVVQWEVVENNHKGKAAFISTFTLTNNGTQLPAKGWSAFFNFPRTIDTTTVTGGMKIRHINGDFYQLTPTPAFKGLGPKQSVKVNFVSGAWGISISDAPAGLYLVWDAAPDKGILLTNYTILPSVRPQQYFKNAADKKPLITPQLVYAQNQVIKDLPMASLPKVFPTPAVYKEQAGTFSLDNSYQIISQKEYGFDNEVSYLDNELKQLFVKDNASTRKSIIFQKGKTNSDSYQLGVTSQNITISSGSNRGLFYGIQSLRSLIPPEAYKGQQTSISIPTVSISDSPRFGYRSFMLDVARNFQTKQQLFKTLDLMALYKLNVLHLHFSDDEGWRLEIPGLPELTEVGARRGHALNDDNFLHPSYASGPDMTTKGSGFYTKADYIELLKYATQRHIRIVPEIETPGHARAAIASMTTRYNRLLKQGRTKEAEQYLLYHPADSSRYRSVQNWHRNVMDVALPSTYTFLEKVVDEIRSMHQEANAPLETIHFGGDEVPGGVWTGSPAVHQLMQRNDSVQTIDDLWYYFFRNINQMLKRKGLTLYGWEEIGMRKTTLDGKPHILPNPEFGNENVRVDVWNNVIGWGAEDLPYRLANAGYKVVLSPVSNMYFDMAYQKAFEEPGYYWGGYLDVDKPFYFIPFDYYRNSTEDINGSKITTAYFRHKERLTDYGQRNTIGLQGLLWSENITSPQLMEYMLLPKMLALAERAWTPNPAWATEADSAKAAQLYGADWSRFVNVVGKRELPRLDHLSGGFQYRIPTVGALLHNGKVQVNTQFPGSAIRYTTDGSEPTITSLLYTEPITKKGVIRLRQFNTTGRGGRTVTIQNK